MKYDFVEIGTSDFDTCLQSVAEHPHGLSCVGLSIEPLRYYLDRLPNLPHVKKLCCAISPDNTNGMLDVYYVPSSVIESNGLPDWLRGCNRVGDYHYQHKRLAITHLVQIEQVPCHPIGELFDREQVTQIDFLKLDTEGNDSAILLHLANWLDTKPASIKPLRILFESNILTDPYLVKQVIDRYHQMGYRSNNRGDDTILELKKSP